MKVLSLLLTATAASAVQFTRAPTNPLTAISLLGKRDTCLGSGSTCASQCGSGYLACSGNLCYNPDLGEVRLLYPAFLNFLSPPEADRILVSQ